MERDRESNEYGRPRRYENEDTTPTSDRELKGWYSYGLAAEIFAVAGVGKYVLPINASISLTVIQARFFRSL
jgi:UMF1 family MFS transporter